MSDLYFVGNKNYDHFNLSYICFKRIFFHLHVIKFAKVVSNTENFSNFILGNYINQEQHDHE